MLTAAQLSRGLLRLLFVLAAARELGPGRFGVYTLLLAMVEMLAVASGSGYIDYLIREAAKDERLGWGLGAQLIWLRLTVMTELALLAQNVYWVRRAVGAVPRPLGWARISLVFVLLLLVTFAGARVVSPLSIGSVCLLLFLIYLYRTGMAGEFAAAWRAEPSRLA